MSEDIIILFGKIQNHDFESCDLCARDQNKNSSYNTKDYDKTAPCSCDRNISVLNFQNDKDAIHFCTRLAWYHKFLFVYETLSGVVDNLTYVYENPSKTVHL